MLCNCWARQVKESTWWMYQEVDSDRDESPKYAECLLPATFCRNPLWRCSCSVPAWERSLEWWHCDWLAHPLGHSAHSWWVEGRGLLVGRSWDLSCSDLHEEEMFIWLVDWRTVVNLHSLDITGIAFELKVKILYALISEIAEEEFHLNHHFEPTHLLVNGLWFIADL